MEHPSSQVAACSLYYEANKEFRFEDEGDRYLCGKAFDCGHCPLLQRWLSKKQQEGYSFGWECIHCLRNSRRKDLQENLERVIPGYYHSGNPDDPDNPVLNGCTHILEEGDDLTGQMAGSVCDHQSSFLQLILRRKRGE